LTIRVVFHKSKPVIGAMKGGPALSGHPGAALFLDALDFRTLPELGREPGSCWLAESIDEVASLLSATATGT